MGNAKLLPFAYEKNQIFQKDTLQKDLRNKVLGSFKTAEFLKEFSKVSTFSIGK